jgi:hypothetical protein
MADVAAKIKPLRPNLTRKIGVPLRVQPRSERYHIVGGAFDYLFRFELQRRAPHAVTSKWVAEYVPDRIWHTNHEGSFGMDLLKGVDPKYYLPPQQVAQRARNIVDDSKAAVAAYLKSKEPSPAQQADLAAHAIRLGTLDVVIRARKLDQRFEEAAAEDIEELVAMLAIVPFGSLVHPGVLLLNPIFGEASKLVGGADADLITGDMIMDIKTIKGDSTDVRYLDQLLGYFLLARKHRGVDPGFPAMKRLGLYFCRHGPLWAVDTTIWTEKPQFQEIEDWFFERAEEVRSAAKKRFEEMVAAIKGSLSGARNAGGGSGLG